MKLEIKLFILVIFCLTGKSICQICSQNVLDLVLAIDSSASIGINNFALAKKALVSMIDSLNIGPTKVKVGIVNYSTNPALIVSLNDTEQEKNNLISAVESLTYYNGETATGDALKMAHDIFFRNPRNVTPRVAVLFTNSSSNIGSNVYTEATKLKDAGVTLISVGITDGIILDELNSISTTSAHVKLFSNYQELYSQINLITALACDASALMVPDSKITVCTEKNELKKFRFDLQKYPSASGIYEISITAVIGFTILSPPFFYPSTRKFDEADWFHSSNSLVEKLTKDGEKALTFLIQPPNNAKMMYFDVVSTGNSNTYHLKIRIFQ